MSPGESSLIYRRRYAALNRPELLRFAVRLSRLLDFRRPFHCLITDDREMRLLNRRYRGKDKPTDVLSFPAEGRSLTVAVPDTPPTPQNRARQQADFLGDLAISYDRAREQAADQGHTIQDEVSILMLHGVLHLAGMDHESDAGEMATREIDLRCRLGLPAGLIERAHA